MDIYNSLSHAAIGNPMDQINCWMGRDVVLVPYSTYPIEAHGLPNWDRHPDPVSSAAPASPPKQITTLNIYL